MRRLPAQPNERIDRSRPLSFTFDGAPVAAFEGDTIASALLASGRRVLSRSFKYHRPRGELCACGRCASSLVQVDGAPGVRACGEPARQGMRVEHQNAWPSLDFDLMRLTDRVGGPFTPVGFYYKTFIRPRRLWPLYERVLRSAAGLGTLPRVQAERRWRTEYRRRHCDLLVVGGGLAGLSAALIAAEGGADVVLCDDGAEPGGELLLEGGAERARDLVRAARAAGAEVLSGASAVGWFDGLVPVWQGDVLHQVRAPLCLAATGAIEQPLVFPGNDLPGTMLADGARRLVELYSVAPGERAVVATVGDAGMEAALALDSAGIEVAAVADLREDARERPAAAALADRGIRLLAPATVVRAAGRDRVQRVTLAPIDPGGRALPGRCEEIACDLLALSGGSAPASSLLMQAGAAASYSQAAAAFQVESLPAGVLAAGSLVGQGDPEAAELSGRIAGAEATIALGIGGDPERERELSRSRATLARRPLAPVACPPAHAHDGRGGGRAFVDLDEDVTVKDVAQALAEGYDSIELAKRYTTATMGPSQGRHSQLPMARLVAALTGRDMAEVGLTTARPPWSAVPLGVLAGRPFEPAKRSAIHQEHRALGANVRWAGDWRRAYDYGDAEAEALAVHRGAGLIDVSTLGKLLVRGPEAGELLDRIYPSRMSTLAPGRIRYGVLLSDSGRITDDGTVCRLDEETFYVTTTSTGAAGVEQWLSWWLADWRLDAQVTDLTQGVAAVNLAGPHARTLLGRLIDIDVSPAGFEYLDARHATIAGVASLVLRIGFVGELGYEIHCPAANVHRLWSAVLAAGEDLGVRPFGLEPQRVLRLQKQHILVGQDTDSESTPYGASMPWAVKLDKPQAFIGRWALQRDRQRDPASVLVGFTVPSGHVPTEGAVVLDGPDGVPAGQVTSARRSPQLGSSIGLAWVPSALATDDSRIAISDGGAVIEAVVTTRPFYDPDGEALRS